MCPEVNKKKKINTWNRRTSLFAISSKINYLLSKAIEPISSKPGGVQHTDLSLHTFIKDNF